MTEFPVFASGQLPADEPAIVGITGEVHAVAVGDGERGSRRSTFLGDVVSEPIQAERRDDDATHATIVAVEGQRKLNDLPGNRQTYREFPDRERTGLQDAGKVGPRRDVDRFTIAVRVAEGLAIQVSHDEGEERRKSRLHGSQICIACLAVPRFDRREF